MANIAGIDPGIAGAIAVLDQQGQVLLVEDLPVHHVSRSNSKRLRGELDLHGIVELLTRRHIAHAFVEQVNSMPKQGVVSGFRFGYAAGSLYGCLVALGIAVTLVPPRRWQGFHHIGGEADAARRRGAQLFPVLAPAIALKKHHNRADALLLALYGRHLIGQDNVGNLAQHAAEPASGTGLCVAATCQAEE
jgi:crossover junction endodeoxyribonuclease RuvC